MTLRDKLTQIDAALASKHFGDCYKLVQEYRGMVSEAIAEQEGRTNETEVA